MGHTTRLLLATTLVLTASAACGDDSPAGGGGTGGEPAASGGSSEGGTSEGGAPSSDGGSGGGTASQCLPADVLATLNSFLASFSAAAGMIAGHPGSNEATGFFLAPGLPEPPGIVATFAGLFMNPCSEPGEFVPYCEQGRCSQLECTANDTSWAFHFYLDGAFAGNDFDISELTIDHHWAEGESGTTFDFAMVATGPEARVWDSSGTGALDVASAALELDFLGLFASPATLTYADSRGGHDGELVVGDVVVATVDAAGQLEPTGDCPL